MKYDFDDIDLGMICIGIIGITGIAAVTYALYAGIGDVSEITAFVVAIGGLIAALAKGKISN